MPGAEGAAASDGAASRGRPSTRSRSARAMPPERSSAGRSRNPTIEDSRPIVVGPASRMQATLSPRSAATWAAVVGLTWPERLALGAATGRPNAASRACATGCAGTRIAIVSRPGGDQIGDPRRLALWQDEGQRPGPEGGGEAARIIADNGDRFHRSERRDVNDQGVEPRASLRSKDRGDGPLAGRVGGEPVDRLGRHPDEFATLERFTCRTDSG